MCFNRSPGNPPGLRSCTQLQLKLQTPQGENTNPIKSFVELEYYNGISVLQNVHKSLAGVSKVIRGSSLLDEKVEVEIDLEKSVEVEALVLVEFPDVPEVTVVVLFESAFHCVDL